MFFKKVCFFPDAMTGRRDHWGIRFYAKAPKNHTLGEADGFRMVVRYYPATKAEVDAADDCRMF